MTRNDYTRIVMELIDSIPDKYSDKHMALLYRQGYLIGMLSDLMYRDNQVAGLVYSRLKQIKQKTVDKI